MKKNLILPLLLALSLPALADPIDDFAQAELERQKIPGLAVGIYRNGNIVKQQGYGLANVEHQIPVSADTVFQTASIGKMFAAAVVMLLVEDGKIHLDQSVRAYCPKRPKAGSPSPSATCSTTLAASATLKPTGSKTAAKNKCCAASTPPRCNSN